MSKDVKTEESDGYSTDDNKRKREEDEEASIFKRSRKITRTPNKETNNKDTGMDEMKNMMLEIMSEIRGIRQQNEDLNKKLDENLLEIKKENMAMKTEIEDLRHKVKKIEELEQRMENIERQSKKNNIVISGWNTTNVSNANIRDAAEQFLKKELQVETKIKNAHKINNRIVVAEVESFEQKLDIMKKKRILNQNKEMKVYINNDLTKKEDEVQKIIRDRAREERGKGKEVKIRFQKIYVGDEELKWDKNKKDLVPTGLKYEKPPKN